MTTDAPIAKGVQIELGGRMRTFRFDFNALCLLEDALGISITEIGKVMSGAVKLKVMRSIVWAALQHEDETLTPKDVGKLLDPADMGKVAEAIRKAFELAFRVEGDQKKAAGTPPPALKDGAGKTT